MQRPLVDAGAAPAGRPGVRKVLDRWRRRPAAWLLLALAAVALGFCGVRARGRKVPVALARTQDLEQHVVASGRVMPPSRINVAARASGLVLVVGAVEGQHVKEGELLVQLEDAEARAQVAQARAAVQQASARVEQLKRVGAIVASQGLRQAQSNFERAQADLARSEELARAGTVPQATLDDSRRALEVARAQREAAEAQQLGTLGADSRVTLGALLQAQAQLKGAEVRLAQTRSVAMRDGVVLTRDVEPGDVVQPARTLLVLAADGDVELVIQPDERHLAVLAKGQRARASADAFPQDVFDAAVSSLAPSVDPARGTVEVRLRVPAPPSFLRPDMTVSVDLTVAAKKGALVLPSEAVRGLASPRPFVLAVEGGQAVRREVRLGLRGSGSLEILEGLSPGAEVILPDGQAVQPGQRVRAAIVER